MTQSRVVVVGGGLTGLSAAVAGGRARSRSTDGFVFNLGPHALYDGPARAFLRELGVPFTGRYSPRGHLVRAGRRHTLPSGPLSLLTTGLLGFGGRLEAARFLGGLSGLDLSELSSITIGQWLRENVRHEDVRGMLAAFVRVSSYSNHPEGQSAEAALDQLQQALRGVIYLDGGWQSLVDGLVARAREAGVALRTRASVGEVDPTRLEVRLADGSSFPADAVLLATDPLTAARLLPESRALARVAARYRVMRRPRIRATTSSRASPSPSCLPSRRSVRRNGAVLLLRDVLDYSVKETAKALRMTAANVNTTHLRARRAMASYDRDRARGERTAAERVALQRFLDCLSRGDAAGLESLLAEGVVGLGDGGGLYAASPRPLVGRSAVMRLYLGTSRRLGALRIEPRSLNHRPAILALTPDAPAGWAPRSVLMVDVDPGGRITRIYSVLAPAKLTAVALALKHRGNATK